MQPLPVTAPTTPPRLPEMVTQRRASPDQSPCRAAFADPARSHLLVVMLCRAAHPARGWGARKKIRGPCLLLFRWFFRSRLGRRRPRLGSCRLLRATRLGRRWTGRRVALVARRFAFRFVVGGTGLISFTGRRAGWAACVPLGSTLISGRRGGSTRRRRPARRRGSSRRIRLRFVGRIVSRLTCTVGGVVLLLIRHIAPSRRLTGVGLGLVAVCPRLVLTVALIACIGPISIAWFCCIAGGYSVAVGSRRRAEVWITRRGGRVPGRRIARSRITSVGSANRGRVARRRCGVTRGCCCTCRAIVGVYPLDELRLSDGPHFRSGNCRSFDNNILRDIELDSVPRQASSAVRDHHELVSYLEIGRRREHHRGDSSLWLDYNAIDAANANVIRAVDVRVGLTDLEHLIAGSRCRCGRRGRDILGIGNAQER